MGDKQTDISSSPAAVPSGVTPLRGQVRQIITEAGAKQWNSRDLDRMTDAVLAVMREQINALPTSMNDVGTTAWVQWLDLAELFGVEQ